MTSPHWDEARAAAYREFRFEFPEKTLAGKTIIVAGGTGGLGAATVMLLAREGAKLIVGYRRNKRPSRALVRRDRTRIRRAKLALVEGDLHDASVRRGYLEAAAKLRSARFRSGHFPGRSGPSRAFTDLDREAMVASLESNYVGPVLLAKDLGEAHGPRENRR